jgi:hypothetical protein
VSNYRDGVSESQFNQVLNIELQQIIEVFFLLPTVCARSIGCVVMVPFIQVSCTVWLSTLTWSYYLFRLANFLMRNGIPSSRWLLPRRIITLNFSFLESQIMSHQVIFHHLPACSGNRVGSIFGDLVIFSNHLDGFICRNCGGQQSLPSKELRFLHVCACWNDRKHRLPLDLVCGHVSFWDCQFALKWGMSCVQI